MRFGGALGKSAVFVIVAGLAVSTLGGAASRASDPDLSWPPAFWDQNQIGFIIEDNWRFTSAIRVASPGSQPVCSSLDDPQCVDLAKRYGWWVLRVAPPCQVSLPWEECIEGISSVPQQGPTRELQFSGMAPGPTFAADEARGLPTGSTMSLFRDPEDPDSSRGYAVYLGGQIGASHGQPFRTGEFAAQIIPYRTVPVGLQPNSGPGGGQCLWVDSGQCAYRTSFIDDAALQLSVRMSKTMTGWLGGRLLDPMIQVEPLDGNLNRLTVTARPVDVPLVAHAMPTSQATPEILDYWKSTFTCPGNVPCTSGVMSGASSGPHSDDHLRLFAGFLGDTATRVIPTWSVTSLPNRSGAPCLWDPDRLVGLVTTNATVYDSGPPVFDSGALRYQVAALHRVPGGGVLEGSYNLVLRSDVARCLYGLSNAPVTASISVTSEDGTEQVATTAVSERDGWLRMAAYGFHFSEPTISVRLASQEPAKTTITCKKGKRLKKVTAVNPVCPPGWKPVSRP